MTQISDKDLRLLALTQDPGMMIGRVEMEKFLAFVADISARKTVTKGEM
ncbi:hypothetical protein [Candidatus Terasakiella magnetica]|nr:hypothetical protein [Candidatus Terasakiella magnetica]